jgi:D-alanyl-D-alanine carboxypeptidase (penicillin-binding protein 5/6)
MASARTAWLGAGLVLVLLAAGRAAVRVAAAEEPAALSHILIDAQSGMVLEEQFPDRPLPADGVARLMVALLTLEQVQLGIYKPEMAVAISAESAAIEAGLLRLDPERTYPIEELLRAIILAGARDATAALADVICWDPAVRVRMLNERARLLGMATTQLVESRDGALTEGGTTTVRDIARLVRALVDHPEVVRWASLPGVPFDGGPVVLSNTNALVGMVVGVDGLQVTRSGDDCSVMATARRNGARVVAVVAGTAPMGVCYDEAARVIERGFRSFASVELVREGEPLNVSIAVERGTVDSIAPVATRSFSYFQRRGVPQGEELSLRYQLPARLRAPLDRNAVVGELIVEQRGRVVAVIPARTPQQVGRSGLF